VALEKDWRGALDKYNKAMAKELCIDVPPHIPDAWRSGSEVL